MSPIIMDAILWVLFFILIVLNIFDIYTTSLIMNHGGKEIGPVMNKLMGLLGKELALIVKFIVIVGMGYYMVFTYGPHLYIIIMLGLVDAVYVYYVFFHNMKSKVFK